MNNEKITPQDAADLLAVPLPFLTALVDCGALTLDAHGLFDLAAVLAHKAFRDAQRAEIDEIEELRALVRFIAADYHELSVEKAIWQRDDWKRRARALLQKYKPTAPAELIPVRADKFEVSKGQGLGHLVDIEEGRRRLHAIAVLAPLAEHSRVVAVREIVEHGTIVPKGAAGTIINVGYHVEFTAPVHAVVAATREDLAPTE